MSGRPGLLLIPAAVAALVLNVLLFAAAALLARDRTVEPRQYDAAAVQLVSLRPPEVDRPDPLRDPPPKPEAPPQMDFMPDLPRPSLDRPQLGDIRVAIDPSLLRGEPLPGNFIFQADDLDQPPRAVVRGEPVYPFKARQRNIEGYVEVKLLVQADGSVASVEVLDASPEGVFDGAALKAVPQWKFEPGRLEGRPVPSWVVTRVVFRIDR